MNKLQIITSQKFSRYNQIKFGFSTRIGGVSLEPYDLNLSYSVGDDRENVIENRTRFFGELGIGLDELAIPRQVQGNVIKRVYVPGGYDSCDGLVANSCGVFLTVSVADCLPVFLFDPITKSIAAVHAGWRGCEMNILLSAIKMMVNEFNSSPSDILAYIGPAADVCCYEVGEEIAVRFDEIFVVRLSNIKPHLNLKKLAKFQLMSGGVVEKNIEISDCCTICNPELFHSYRRDKEKSGRMMGVIGMIR